MFDKSLGDSDKPVTIKGQLHEGHEVKGIRYHVTVSHSNNNVYIYVYLSERRGGGGLITFLGTKDKPKC